MRNIKAPRYFTNTKRQSQRSIQPTAIKQRQVSSDLITNTSLTIATVDLPEDSRVTVESTIDSTVSPRSKIGTVPYMITFFENSVSESNIIASGGSVTATDYLLFGPFAVPQIGTSDIGTNGANIKYITTLSRVAAGTETIIIYIQSRIIQSFGGGQGQTS